MPKLLLALFDLVRCGSRPQTIFSVLPLILPIVLNPVMMQGAESVVATERDAQIRFPLPENVFALDGKLSCGPRCVHFVLELYRREISYDQVIQECSPGPNGTSLKQLQDCLKSHGLKVLPLAGPISQAARQLKIPMIARMESKTGAGHFVVIVKWDEQSGKALIYDPPTFYGQVPADEFSHSLSGIGLIVSDETLPSIDDLVSANASMMPLAVTTGFSLAVLFASVWGLFPKGLLHYRSQRK